MLWEIAAQERPDLLSILGIEGGAFIITLLQKLKAGERLPSRPGWPQWIADIMQQCWRTDPRERPTFSQICDRLQELTGAVAESKF